MAKDSNELGTTILPGGLDISVPDLTVARPVDTLVEFNGAVLRSTDAVTPTYVSATGGQGSTLVDTALFGAQGGSFAIAIPAGAEGASLVTPTSGGFLLSLIAVSDAGGSFAVTSVGSNTEINAAGATVMTFADVDASVVLLSVQDAVGFQWRTIDVVGVVLS